MFTNNYEKKDGYYLIKCNLGYVKLDIEKAYLIPERKIYTHVKGKYACYKYNGKSVKLHRMLMDVTDPKIQVDHINGDPLDNRMSNLRLCTNALNCRNRGNRKNSAIPYKGVNKTVNGKYLARIQINGRRMSLGRFKTPEEAAKAYNKAALKYHGEFAKLNKV